MGQLIIICKVMTGKSSIFNNHNLTIINLIKIQGQRKMEIIISITKPQIINMPVWIIKYR
jgi:hypothetical protein